MNTLTVIDLGDVSFDPVAVVECVPLPTCAVIHVKPVMAPAEPAEFVISVCT